MTAKKRRRKAPAKFDGARPFYTTAELAAMLNVTVQTLRVWRHAGKGPAFIREGPRIVVYLKDSVMEWLKRCERRVQTVEKRRGPIRRKRRTTEPVNSSGDTAS